MCLQTEGLEVPHVHMHRADETGNMELGNLWKVHSYMMQYQDVFKRLRALRDLIVELVPEDTKDEEMRIVNVDGKFLILLDLLDRLKLYTHNIHPHIV